MSNIVLLFACLCIGIVLGHRRWLPPNTPAVLNSFILFVSLPALNSAAGSRYSPAAGITLPGRHAMAAVRHWLWLLLVAGPGASPPRRNDRRLDAGGRVGEHPRSSACR